MSADEFMLSGPEAADGHQFEALGGPALSGGLGRKASKTGRYAIIVAVPNEDSEDNVSTDFTCIGWVLQNGTIKPDNANEGELLTSWFGIFYF